MEGVVQGRGHVSKEEPVVPAPVEAHRHTALPLHPPQDLSRTGQDLMVVVVVLVA